MRYSGVLFDLIGTLIPPFRKREHMDTIRECASHLEVDFETCQRQWGETFSRRIRGEFASIADGFNHIARELGSHVSSESLSNAEKAYTRLTLDGLTPVDGALETLDWLVSRGVRIGLVTNCAPDIPLVWPQSVFAKYFEYCAFSCDVGAVKPEPEIYLAALSALDLLPEQTLFVGDGSDEELTGAARCGMHPVLVRVDLCNTYDTKRKDVDNWEGPEIKRISEIPRMIT